MIQPSPAGGVKAGSPVNQHRKESRMKENKDKITGPDFAPKEPTPYLYDAPADVPFPGKHQDGVGGPSDRNNNGVDDSKE